MAFLISVLAGVVFGVMPLRQIFKTDPNDAIKSGGSQSSAGRRWALRDVLLAAQIALCCVTVTAAFVSLRGLGRALTMDMGFNPQTCRADEIRTEPGRLFQRGCRPFPAPAAGKSLAAPGSGQRQATRNPRPSLSDTSDSNVFSQQTTDFRPSNRAFDAYDYDVSPGYFAAAETPLLAGRDVSFTDTAKTPAVAVVNQEFARRLFHSERRRRPLFQEPLRPADPDRGHGGGWKILFAQ